MAIFGFGGGSNDVSNNRNRTRTSPGPTNAAVGTGADQGGRRRPPDAPVIGTAVPRGTANQPTPPEQINPVQAQSSAAAAAIRARRKGAGASILTGLNPGQPAPAARLSPRTLVGY